MSVFKSDAEKLTFALVAAGIVLRSVKLLRTNELVAGGVGFATIALMFVPGFYSQLPIKWRTYFGVAVLVLLFTYSFVYGVGWSR